MTKRPIDRCDALRFGIAVVACAIATPIALAQTDETVVVIGELARSLDEVSSTSSRLGLSAQDTPQTIDTISADEILGRGFLSVEQAAESLPGVLSGGSPVDLAAYSVRGFTGAQVTQLRDGLYTGPSGMTSRPQNAFNLQSVELLKGPASVLYGQGAVGGAVNAVSKTAEFGAPSYQVQLAGGSFGSTAFGVGATGALTERLAGRIDVSNTQTDGFVENTPGRVFNATASLLWRPSDVFDVQFLLDYMDDEPSAYLGTPLVTRSFATNELTGVVSDASGLTLDERLRFKTYNVADNKIAARSWWPRLTATWRPAEGVTVRNLAYYYEATRRWVNSEVYAFNPTTNLIDRDRFFVFHDQELFGNQTSLSLDRDLLGLTNTFVAGLDYSRLDFVRSRGFPDGDSVDPFRPSPGLFGPIVPRVSPTKWDQTALFFENATDLTKNLKLVLGGRAENLALDRKNFNAAGVFQPGSSFTRDLDSTTWRVGLVYDLNEYLTPYVSWTTGADPVGSNILLVNAAESFDLSESQQVEIGLKARLPDNRGVVTLAAFDIERKNLLTQVAVDQVANIGSQESTGVEMSADYLPTRNWLIRANAAYVDARFGTFVDPNFGVAASGNTPPNVPEWTASLWTRVSDVAGLPLELGGGLRYVGDRFGNTSNTLVLNEFVLVDLQAAYRLSDRARLSVQANNLLDEAYARWADVFYPTQLQLGAPRSYQVTLDLSF